MRELFLILVLISTSAFADAYKCKSPSGHVVFTEKPCDPGYTNTRAVSSAGVDDVAVARAQSDLERQKAWLAGREQIQREDAAAIARLRVAAEAAYPSAPSVPAKSESIFDKPWGCGNRSCSAVSNRR